MKGKYLSKLNGNLSDPKIVENEVWVSYNHPPASQPIIWLDFSEFPRVGPVGSALCTFISSFPVLSQLCITIIATSLSSSTSTEKAVLTENFEEF